MDLPHDFILPTLLFISLGAMTWAVRGCSGFGAMNGCAFAGVTWGAAWWFLSRDPRPSQSRPYTSGWIILALTIGIGISGNRGWMQWPSFFEGHLQTNSPRGEFVPISRSYGFLWLFIAGVPWAGLGACLLAWCNSERTPKLRDWALRLACGAAAVWLARTLFHHYPEIFLPLYKSLKSRYDDLPANPNLRRLMGDNRAAILHLGLYLGLLFAEMIRRAWRNVALIGTVGLVNGIGWSLCQNWKWAPGVWPEGKFNWWRCWESSGGISIGLAYGIAYFICNRPLASSRQMIENSCNLRPNLERFGAYLGLIFGLGLALKNGLKGWANIYIGDERHWNHVLWQIIGPLMLLATVGIAIQIYSKRFPQRYDKDLFPHSYALIWLVLIWQNVIAQLVTGPRTVWTEMAFKLYYLLLFLISAVIVFHYHQYKITSLALAENEPKDLAAKPQFA